MEYIHHLPRIEYFQLNIEYLWNAARREPQGRTIDIKKRRSITRRKRLRCASDSLNIQFSIINSQFQLVQVKGCTIPSGTTWILQKVNSVSREENGGLTLLQQFIYS